MPERVAINLADGDRFGEVLATRPALSQVYIGGFANHPRDLVQILVDQGAAAKGVTAQATLPSGLRTPLKEWRHGHVVLTHAIDGFETALATGTATFRHTHVSDSAAQLRMPGRRTTFVRVTPPDAEGRCHLGFSVDQTLDAIHGSELVLAELDPALPRPAGNSWIYADDIFMAVAATPQPPRTPRSSGEASAAEQEVARRVAELIPDGVSLELGMGRLPDAVADHLRDHVRLRLHTGIITPSVVRLLESGAVDESPPAPHLAPVVAMMGTDDPYVRDALTNDPRIELHPASTTHNRLFLSSLAHFHAVNGALGVALDGAVNSEFHDGRRVSAVGGLMDFREGARLSTGGKFVTALTATRSGGGSRIVPVLDAPATVPASDAGWVVTEYGAVDLSSLDTAERAEALTELAHPDHRATLAAAARRR